MKDRKKKVKKKDLDKVIDKILKYIPQKKLTSRKSNHTKAGHNDEQ